VKSITAGSLRDIVQTTISKSIETHRASRTQSERESYVAPTGPPTEEEIDDFIASNSLLDEETHEQLLDPGLLGFDAKTATASKSWLRDFHRNVSDWAENNSWLGADLPWRTVVVQPIPAESNFWRPTESTAPGWLSIAPPALLLAADLIRNGRLLAEMPWRKFEEMIGALLEAQGWSVEVTRPTKDGGIDVVAFRDERSVGRMKSLWQAKCYGLKRSVRLSEVRELAAIVDRERATKGVLVTTSRLTRDAIDWIKRDWYRLDYKDHVRLERWIRMVLLGHD
jgi:restriction system protein